MTPLHLTATCLHGCPPLDSGLSTDPPLRRRGPDWTRWAEVDRAAARHVEETGHATRVSAVAVGSEDSKPPRPRERPGGMADMEVST